MEKYVARIVIKHFRIKSAGNMMCENGIPDFVGYYKKLVNDGVAAGSVLWGLIAKKFPSLQIVFRDDEFDMISHLTVGEYMDQLMDAGCEWKCPITKMVGDFDDDYFEANGKD